MRNPVPKSSFVDECFFSPVEVQKGEREISRKGRISSHRPRSSRPATPVGRLAESGMQSQMEMETQDGANWRPVKHMLALIYQKSKSQYKDIPHR